MEIYQYIRDKKRAPIGVMYANIDGDDVKIGWSKCKVTGRNRDKFDKKLGRKIARDRAEKYKRWVDKTFVYKVLLSRGAEWNYENEIVPDSVANPLKSFCFRVNRILDNRK